MHAPPLAGLRSHVLALIAREPGATPSDVAKTFQIDHSTAAYHLRRLEKAQLVSAQNDGRALRYYASGCGICPFLRLALPTLRDPRYQEILGALEGRAARLPQLADDPREAARVRNRLARLAQMGFVVHDGGAWYPTPDTRVCREQARGTGACDQWGRCAVSRRWRQAEATPLVT